MPPSHLETGAASPAALTAATVTGRRRGTGEPQSFARGDRLPGVDELRALLIVRVEGVGVRRVRRLRPLLLRRVEVPDEGGDGLLRVGGPLVAAQNARLLGECSGHPGRPLLVAGQVV